MALTKAKLMELIDNGDIDVGGGGFSPNILHNWDFRNPVNQRGVSGAISTGTYFFDRWIRNSGTVTVAAGYLVLASGAVIEQRIEGLYLAGETVTVSVMVGSTIYNGTGVFPISAGTAAVTLTGFGTATLGYNSGYMFVRFSADAERNVTSVKVELGTASTLHLDPPMDHAVELLKCQRYLQLFSNVFRGLAGNNSTTTAWASFPLPVFMRVTPSISGISSFWYWTQTNMQETTQTPSVTLLGRILYLQFAGFSNLPEWRSGGFIVPGQTGLLSADL